MNISPMGDSPKMMNSKDVRDQWRHVLNSVLTGETILVGRYNTTEAALVPIDKYEKMQRALRLLEEMEQGKA
jgi:antitoxin (DNA-binding transcriptional repressor) of toxin-antitoxin stability system